MDELNEHRKAGGQLDKFAPVSLAIAEEVEDNLTDYAEEPPEVIDLTARFTARGEQPPDADPVEMDAVMREAASMAVGQEISSSGISRPLSPATPVNAPGIPRGLPQGKKAKLEGAASTGPRQSDSSRGSSADGGVVHPRDLVRDTDVEALARGIDRGLSLLAIAPYGMDYWLALRVAAILRKQYREVVCLGVSNRGGLLPNCRRRVRFAHGGRGREES